jgi:hypothetical protein
MFNMKESLRNYAGGAAATAVLFSAMALAGMDHNVDEDKMHCKVSGNFASVFNTQSGEEVFNSANKRIYLDKKDDHCSIWATDHFINYKRQP